MIKVNVFDLGNTTVFFDYMKFCKKLAKYSSMSSNQIYKKVYNTDIETQFTSGKISPQKFYKEVCRRTGTKISYTKFKEAFDVFTKKNYPVVKIIKRLRKRYKLLLLSNTNILHFNTAKKKFNNPVLENFNSFILSYKIKMIKPDRNIYQHTIKVAKAKPSEIVFVDDMERNIRGAKKLGIHGIRYTSAKKLEKDLKRLNVVF